MGWAASAAVHKMIAAPIDKRRQPACPSLYTLGHPRRFYAETCHIIAASCWRPGVGIGCSVTVGHWAWRVGPTYRFAVAQATAQSWILGSVTGLAVDSRTTSGSSIAARTR
jgi:hypothetical protein